MNLLKEDLHYQLSKYIMMYKINPGPYYLHWHNEVELMYVTNGPVYYTVNQKNITLEKGDFIVVNSGDIHSLGENDFSGEAYILVVNVELLQKNFHMDNFYTAFFPGEALAQDANYKQILPAIEMLFWEYNQQEETRESCIAALIQLIFIYSSRCYALSCPLTLPNKRMKESETCRQIIDFFDRTEPSQYQLEKLADDLGYSVNHLCKVFKRIFGRSFHQYAVDLKIAYAQEMLQNTNFQISEISLKCGFSSERVFNMAFKKAVQLSPSQYRRKYQ